jgi:hypothetical protein
MLGVTVSGLEGRPHLAFVATGLVPRAIAPHATASAERNLANNGRQRCGHRVSLWSKYSCSR